MCRMTSERTPCLAARACIPSRYRLICCSSLSVESASHNSTSALISITSRTYKMLEQVPAIRIASWTAALLYSEPSVATSNFSKPRVGHVCLAMAPSRSIEMKFNTALQQRRRELGKIGALALHERNMARDGLFLEPINHVGEAVARRVDIRIVYLIRVAGQHDFGPLPRPGDDGLDLVGREVLGLVHDQVLVRHAPAADIGERLHLDHAEIEEALEVLPALAPRHGGRCAHEKIEVVADRLHPGPELLLDVARQKPDVLAQGEDGAGDHQPLVGPQLDGLFQAQIGRQEGLAGAGLAHEGHEPDIVVQEKVQGELLLLVPGTDSPDPVLGIDDVHESVLLPAEAAEGGLGRIGAALQQDELVREQRSVRSGNGQFALVVEFLDGL